MSTAQSRTASLRAIIPDLPWMGALFVVTLGAALRMMGSSPRLWDDTNIENGIIDDCLLNNHCTMLGQGATVGIYHSAGYFHCRALLAWLGFGPDATFRLLLVLGALSVVFATLVARRLEGRAAAAVAAVLMFAFINQGMQFDAITDVAPVPFLGTVFLLVAIAAVARPSLGLTALLGMVSAILFNVYATSLSCELSALLIAWRSPNRRAHVAVALAAFAIPAFLMAPATWVVDAQLLLHHSVPGYVQPTGSRRLWEIPVMVATGIASGTWVWAWRTRRTALLKQIEVPAIIFVPMFAALAIGDITGFVRPWEKYCAHIAGAVAVGLGLAVAHLARRFAFDWERRAPYFSAGLIVLEGLVRYGTGPAELTSHDIDAARVMLQERGWGWPDVPRDLKVIDDTTRHATLPWARSWPQPSRKTELDRAYLIKVPDRFLPRDLPKNASVVDSVVAGKTLLVSACSWIDWSTFRVCVKDSDSAAERCVPSALPSDANTLAQYWPHVPGMPDTNTRQFSDWTVTLHFPLHPSASCPEEAIWLPKDLPRICPGRLLSADGTPLADAGTVTKWSRESAPKEVAIQWRPGAPECWVGYRGWPPFFVEGEPAAVDFLKTTLSQPELKW